MFNNFFEANNITVVSREFNHDVDIIRLVLFLV
jgi:hypothetical protein